jgi:cell division septation protein DedD
MTDVRADEGIPLEDEDRLPWLEAVDEDDERDGPSAAKLIVAVVIGLIAIGLVVGGLFWISNRQGEAPNGAPETIAAPDGDYKVKPAEPGGMKVEGEGDTSFAASTGEEPKGTINMNAVPEAPVNRPAPAPKTAPVQAAPKAAAPAPVPARSAAPAPAPVAAGGSIQLGAFSSSAGANNAWKALSQRFKYLAPLTHSVTPVTVGGRTLYRLRASGAGAEGVCRRLQIAGETCVTI